MRILLAAVLCSAAVFAVDRTTLSLDGEWQLTDSVAGTPVPSAFSHRAPVPGLAHSATPPLADVDRFDSRELIDVEIRDKRRPESERTTAVGTPHQNRTYMWYRRTFRLPAARQVATLRINKAQFGSAVWINGKPAGEHLGSFSAGIFDIAKLVNWNADNEVVIRIGAHPGAVPAWVPTGTDKEKYKWTPGIYDSVSVELSDNPAIETIQVAPRIATSEILVQTVVRNAGTAVANFALRHTVHGWREKTTIASSNTPNVSLAPGERKTITTTLRIPNPRLWSTESPALYVIDTNTGGDSISTRFGMREFRFDTATRRAYLNGKMIFLRGSNIGLHRFFEDPLSKQLPWDHAWVRRLLATIPNQLHWNSFRWTLGPAPSFWLDIADEAGLLIQNEFPIWQGHWDDWRADEVTTEYSEWMRDQWNHPSLVIWDASNETHAEWLRDNVLGKVRPLDLSDRPWDNGYTLPTGPNDPVEDHPYFFIAWWKPANYKPFELVDLEKMTGDKTDWNAPHPTTHPVIVNEYPWLWVNRDGSPTLLTENVYSRLLGDHSTAEQRFETYGYLLGGLTEFWRAHRKAAGVQYFVYLTCSYPGVKTSDNFRDITKLELEPHFADYASEAFKPLGVYINFWQPRLDAEASREYAVMMINDDAAPHNGKLRLLFDEHNSVEVPFTIPAYGQQTFPLVLRAPTARAAHVLKAVATYEGGQTISRRKVDIQ